MNARKGLSSTVKIGGIAVLAILLVTGMVGGAFMFMQGSIAGDTGLTMPPTTNKTSSRTHRGHNVR